MPSRNATAAVIGAGDFIGSAIAERFAREGYTVLAGRRTAEKLAASRRQRSRKPAGAASAARSMPARKKTSSLSSMKPTRSRRWKSASSIPAPM